MTNNAKSIRTFIGARDFTESRSFYNDLGFVESVISDNMSYFNVEGSLGFYLQNSYVEDWVNNSMIFLEVENAQAYWEKLKAMSLADKYPNVRLVPVRTYDWGSECFLHDPAGILWHFGEFKAR